MRRGANIDGDGIPAQVAWRRRGGLQRADGKPTDRAAKRNSRSTIGRTFISSRRLVARSALVNPTESLPTKSQLFRGRCACEGAAAVKNRTDRTDQGMTIRTRENLLIGKGG